MTLLMFVGAGNMLVQVAWVVEHVQQEQEIQRDQIQTTVYAVRHGFECVGSLVVVLCCNSIEYGGTFEWSVSLNHLLILPLICVIPAVITTRFCIHEQKFPISKSFAHQLEKMWEIAHGNAISMYAFLSGSSLSLAPASSVAIVQSWTSLQLLAAPACTLLRGF